MKVVQVENKDEKKKVTRKILEALKDWFEVDESREEYIEKSVDHLYWAAYDEDEPVGFLYLNETSKDTVELCVMGVLKEYHRHGLGRKLFEEACDKAEELGYSFIQVKTVKMGVYEEYDRTNRFYQSVGFKELEVIPQIWDDANPCQIYIMSLK